MKKISIIVLCIMSITKYTFTMECCTKTEQNLTLYLPTNEPERPQSPPSPTISGLVQEVNRAWEKYNDDFETTPMNAKLTIISALLQKINSTDSTVKSKLLSFLDQKALQLKKAIVAEAARLQAVISMKNGPLGANAKYVFSIFLEKATGKQRDLISQKTLIEYEITTLQNIIKALNQSNSKKKYLEQNMKFKKSKTEELAERIKDKTAIAAKVVEIQQEIRLWIFCLKDL